ncbi:response regulator [Novosphingobium percolationis]|uniref:hypothetical protein n=1 Tax=Novosphingobium percolationis TaxID=2871811 RepID=UPI001CD3DA34|nr:hypothetical protein [Novosphingobium percolationis]
MERQRDTAEGGCGEPRKVLVVEDNLLVAMEIEDALLAHGLTVEIAETVQAAEQCIGRTLFGAALVDCRLPDGHAHDIALRLEARGTRAALVTGSDATGLPSAIAHLPLFDKPVPAWVLAEWVLAALRER